jgi:hypothetical protein
MTTCSRLASAVLASGLVWTIAPGPVVASTIVATADTPAPRAQPAAPTAPAAPSTARRPGEIDLRPKFEPGQSDVYTLTLVSTNKAKTSDDAKRRKGDPAADALASVPVDSKVTQEIRLRQRVVKVVSPAEADRTGEPAGSTVELR